MDSVARRQKTSRQVPPETCHCPGFLWRPDSIMPDLRTIRVIARAVRPVAISRQHTGNADVKTYNHTAGASIARPVISPHMTASQQKRAASRAALNLYFSTVGPEYLIDHIVGLSIDLIVSSRAGILNTSAVILRLIISSTTNGKG